MLEQELFLRLRNLSPSWERDFFAICLLSGLTMGDGEVKIEESFQNPLEGALIAFYVNP